MEAAKQIETRQPTPEQLLKLLELQLAQERSKRTHRSRNRAAILVVGIVSILAAAGVALIIAQSMLIELQNREATPPGKSLTDDGR
ncbi:MAG: hypothetical protein WCF18_13170 [Chthoniobacteraceae bacterium]